MAKVLSRYRNPNGDTLYIQKRSLNIFTIWGYGLWKLFVPLFVKQRNPVPEWCWVDWTNFKNKIFTIDRDLNYHAAEIERLLKERAAAESELKAEIATLSRDAKETRGFSAPFMVDTNDLLPIGLDIEDPGTYWKKVVNPKLSGNVRKTASGKTFDDRRMQGGTTHQFYPEEMDQFKVAFDALASERGVDSTGPYHHQKKGKSGGGKGGGGGNFNPKNRKRQNGAGETEEGHQDRLRAIQDGCDMSDWQVNQPYYG